MLNANTLMPMSSFGQAIFIHTNLSIAEPDDATNMECPPEKLSHLLEFIIQAYSLMYS
jgi:hypothetical protein